MNWDIWEDKYRKIRDELDLDKSEDIDSARVLNGLISKEPLSTPREMVGNKSCIIFGGGPSLETDLEKISQKNWLDKVIISADGATSAVLDYKVPDIIVTDLDGNVQDQIKAWEDGAWIFIHAHGDNKEKLRKFASRFDERVIGTTQVDISSGLYSFGGFTDGDRAAFTANELDASRIYLAGMDLGDELGKYGKSVRGKEKLKKLEICKNLLSWLSDELSANLINVTSNGENIPQVPKKEI